MENPIPMSNLNDFVFCPLSIFFHGIYDDYDTMLLQNTDQRNGTFVHETVDKGGYSSRKDILTGFRVYSERYGLIGKIDCYDGRKKELIERKKRIREIFDIVIFAVVLLVYWLF